MPAGNWDPAGDWDSYFWPGSQVLRNLYGLREADELARREYISTARRARQLTRGDVSIEATFDAAHLRALHRHLFRDVFEWAGRFRTVDIAKDGRGFAPQRLIGHYLDQTRVAAVGVDWAHVDRGGFARGMAAVYAPLNQAHPFREGNGRTGRAFLDAIAETSPFRLDHARIDPAVWNQRSAMSGPDLGYLQVQPQWLEPVFAAMTAPRPAAPVAERPAVGEGRALSEEERRMADFYRRYQKTQGPGAGHPGPGTPGAGEDAQQAYRGPATGQGRGSGLGPGFGSGRDSGRGGLGR